MKKPSVLITGSSRGIGKACALAFAKGGFFVFINSRKNLTQLTQVQKEIEEMGGVCHVLPGDVSKANEVKDIFSRIKKVVPGLDVLVNNAGISQMGLLSDLSDENWEDILRTNLSSAFYCSKSAIPYMVHQKKGKIINISSIWGRYGASCEVAYSTSKAGLDGFTKALAKELAPSNIQVNAISCGMIDTAMNQVFSEEELINFIQDIPTGRLGLPEEVANLAIDLAVNHEYLTGQIIGLDGGY